MAREIGMWEGKVYGHEVSEYGRKNGYLDYRTLAEIVGDMVLCNGIIRNTWESCGEWELENGTDYDEETDSYADVYQEYIVNSRGAEWLKENTDELVWYNDTLDLEVWGITHWGTGWDYVLTDVKLHECETFEELCEFNFKQ
jgi:hypothetical protein